MNTMTGIALAQQSGFISRCMMKKLVSLVLSASEKGVKRREALSLTLSTGSIKMEPRSIRYLETITEVCDD